MKNKEILDACCGSKMFWFEKNDPNTLYVDIREETIDIGDRITEIKPDEIQDFRNLPYTAETFSLVIFDPPHLRWAGQKSIMRAKYGRLEESWREDIFAGFSECWRVLKQNGTLIFKWNEAQIPLKEILKVIPVAPILGNRGHGGSKPKTHWLVFFKSNAGGGANDPEAQHSK